MSMCCIVLLCLSSLCVLCPIMTLSQHCSFLIIIPFGFLYGLFCFLTADSYGLCLNVLDITLCDTCVSDLWQVGGFLLVLGFPPPIKFTFPEHLSSPTVFSGVRITRTLVWYVCFVDRCLFFCAFSFGRCVVYSSSIYGFWLPRWYLQTLLTATI